MASSCCSFVVSPGLLGQLILATVAIHAARNSRSVCGDDPATAAFVARFDDEQE